MITAIVCHIIRWLSPIIIPKIYIGPITPVIYCQYFSGCILSNISIQCIWMFYGFCKCHCSSPLRNCVLLDCILIRAEVSLHSIFMVDKSYHCIFTAKLVICVITITVIYSQSVLYHRQCLGITGRLCFIFIFILHKLHITNASQVVATLRIAPTEIIRRHIKSIVGISWNRGLKVTPLTSATLRFLEVKCCIILVKDMRLTIGSKPMLSHPYVPTPYCLRSIITCYRNSHIALKHTQRIDLKLHIFMAITVDKRYIGNCIINISPYKNSLFAICIGNPWA